MDCLLDRLPRPRPLGQEPPAAGPADAGRPPLPPTARGKAKSLLAIDAAGAQQEDMAEGVAAEGGLGAPPFSAADARARSMEFLLDDDNKASVQVSTRGVMGREGVSRCEQV